MISCARRAPHDERVEQLKSRNGGRKRKSDVVACCGIGVFYREIPGAPNPDGDGGNSIERQKKQALAAARTSCASDMRRHQV